MAADPSNPNPPPRPKRLGCLAKLGLGLVICVLLIVGLHFYADYHEAGVLVERATAALLANDPATALVALHEANERRPGNDGIAQLYQSAQQKWLESVDRQLADQTPAQRYATLGRYATFGDTPLWRLSQCLSESLATTFQQFIERNAVDTQAQIQETVERAMDLVEAGKTREGREAMETLRVCHNFPGLAELWENFNTALTARLLINAGDLGQNEQIAAAREKLAWAQKNLRPSVDAAGEALFRIDLADYSLHLMQAVSAAAKGDQKSAEIKIEEAKPLLSHLLANPELQNFYSDLPPKDRGTPLIDQLNAAQFVLRKISASTPGR